MHNYSDSQSPPTGRTATSRLIFAVAFGFASPITSPRQTPASSDYAEPRLSLRPREAAVVRSPADSAASSVLLLLPRYYYYYYCSCFFYSDDSCCCLMMMSIRTRCPLGSTACAVLVVPSFRPPPFFSPRKNHHHHHLYYPFFPLSSPLVVSHLITPRRKPLRHLSMRPIRRRRSSTRVSFPVARTSDFFMIVVSRPLLFPPRKKSPNNCSFARRRNYLQEENKEEEYSGVLSSRFLSFFYSRERVVLLSLSLSLLQREEKKRKIPSFWRDYSRVLSFYLKKTLSLFCGCDESSHAHARKPPKSTEKERETFLIISRLFFFFSFFLSAFFHFWWWWWWWCNSLGFGTRV